MTAGTSSPDKNNLQPLKKRKIEIKDESNDNRNNDIQSFQGMDTNVKCINKENTVVTQNTDIKDTSNEKDNNGEHSQASNCENSQTNDLVPKIENNEENTNTVKNETENDNEKIVSDTQNSLITIRKVEDLQSTPEKNAGSNDMIDATNIKIENTSSPQIFSSSTLNTDSIEWHSRSIKSLSETPVSKKGKHLYENSTPVLRRKRKLSSNIGDCDRLSDVLKSEMYDTGLNDMEPIAMLHDLDSVIDFEDTKLHTEFLSSTAVNFGQDDHNMELSRDPQTDPLFIENNDENDTASEDDETRQEEETPEASTENERKRRSVTNYIKSENENTVESESSTEDDDETYDFIKSILGELDIKTDPESRQVSTETETQLYNLEVQLMHDVPPQHKVERSAGSRALTETERQLFLKYGPIKKGVFSPEEDKTIVNNWKTFCKVHNWDPKNTESFVNLRNGNKFYIRSTDERQKFVQFLANGLPWRTLFSIYQRFKKLFERKKKHFQRYTLAEDEQILSYLRSNHVKKSKKRHTSFAELAKILDRPSHSIWLRYQLLKKMQQNQSGQPLTHVKWTLTLISKFIKSLMGLTLCERVEDLKDATIPKPVWLKLEDKLSISHDVLKLFWLHQLHMQLFCRDSIYMNDIKIKVIEYIYRKGFTNTREIIWPNVVKYFEGLTSVFLCKIFFYLVQNAIVKIGSKNLVDIMEYLYHEKIRDIRNELTDKFLPRLSYSNGKVKIIDEDINELIE